MEPAGRWRRGAQRLSRQTAVGKHAALRLVRCKGAREGRNADTGQERRGETGADSKGGINASRKGCRTGKEGPAQRGNLRGAASRLSRTLEGVVGACGAACLEGIILGGLRLGDCT